MENKEREKVGLPRPRFRKINTVDLVTISIAREAILLDLGDRMRTVDDYVEMFDVSRGTVQKALSRLEDSGAVSIEKRGVLGSFLNNRDRDILWHEADWGHLTGAGAIPRTRRQESLASAIYTAFEEAELPFSLAYLQGAIHRVQGLLANQYDFVLASKSAAELIVQEYGDKIKIAIVLEPYSYLTGYTIVTRVGDDPKSAKRIGIDPNSPDHAVVARRVFGERVENGEADFVELHFTKMPRAVEAGRIDAFVFNVDVMDYVFNVPPVDLHDIPFDLDLADLTRAVVLTSTNNYRMDDLLRDILRPDSLAAIQQDVLDGKRLPHFVNEDSDCTLSNEAGFVTKTHIHRLIG